MNKKKVMANVLIIILLLINIVRLFNDTLWADECFTYELVKHDVFGILEGTINDFHPPLYYLITKLFAAIFNYSIVGYRVSSLVAVILLAFFGFQLIKNLFGKLEAFIFTCCVLIAPTMYYTVEMRMYSWAYMFITLFILFSYKMLHNSKKSDTLWMILIGVAAAYTHYFALIMIASIYFVLLLISIIRKNYKNIKKIVICIISSIILYLPWIGIVFNQMAAYGKTELEFKSLTYYFKIFAGFICLFTGTLRTVVNISIPETILTVICALIMFIIIIKNFISAVKEKKAQLDLYIIFIVALILSYLAGIFMDILSHTFVARYLYPLTGFIWIILSVSITDMIRKKEIWAKEMAVMLLIIFITDSMITIYEEYQDEIKNNDTIAFINENVGSNDIIVTDYRLYSWIVLRYYFPDIHNEFCEEQNFDNYKNYDHIWYIHALQNDTNPILLKYNWSEQLTSSLGENDFILYKLE